MGIKVTRPMATVVTKLGEIEIVDLWSTSEAFKNVGDEYTFASGTKGKIVEINEIDITKHLDPKDVMYAG